MEFIWIAIGLALLGYFIGDGLKNFGHPNKEDSFPYFVKENELHYYIQLSEAETKALLQKYPQAPKMELNGQTLYPLRQFQKWLHELELVEKDEK
ncbi:hypothetical protein [Kurthia massiliensis]|uniref:hypothetical protein n=1 Tax=Kurthia massiliensis TaxID=1033739 RepID=UPI000288D5F5|nr:hypothetical protein [Kurthia massiliensis]